jgi:hypothetical protein
MYKVRFILRWYIKDNHIIKLVTQEKEVVNKVTVNGLWLDYKMIPWRGNT